MKTHHELLKIVLHRVQPDSIHRGKNGRHYWGMLPKVSRVSGAGVRRVSMHEIHD